MPRLVRNLFVDALGYDTTDYEQENDWNDVRFYDDDRNPAVIVEGKRRDVSVEEGVEQVFRYAAETAYARYLVVTNVDRMLVYRRCDESAADETHHGISGKLLADVPFQGLVADYQRHRESGQLSLNDRQALKQLLQLRAEEIRDPARYDEFEIYDRQNVASDEGFETLVETLSDCLDNYLLRYTLAAFDEHERRYAEFRKQADDLEEEIEQLRAQNHDDSEVAELEVDLASLREEYAQSRSFHSGYQTWKRLSQRQNADPDDNKEVFCRETVYVQLNKMLLIRIAEDQGLTSRMVSNGGVTQYFDFWDNYGTYTTRDYTDLFAFASEELSEVYDHLYSQRIFDWTLQDGDELNEVIQRTLWHLNHFDFSDVSRDVLGRLYEEHLDPERRSELGGFYTPTSLVDFLLDAAGYTSDKPLELPEYDLLDPACGSGTFLVRATQRLLDRLESKGVGPRESLRIVQERIHGFDIDLFATHIAEMNLLFQVIDLYRDVKRTDEEYTLDRFNIYRTDSLRTEESQPSLTATLSDTVQYKYREERRDARSAKGRDDYGFVVGNPPFVRVQNLPDGPARNSYDDYYTAYYNYDLYCLFVERAAGWLADGGTLSLVLSNKFVESRYGQKLREFALANFELETIIDFQNTDVFRNAKAFPMLFTATRRNVNRQDRSPEEFVLTEQYEFIYSEIDPPSFETLIEDGQIRHWDDVGDRGNGDVPTVTEGLRGVCLDDGTTSRPVTDAIEVYPVSSEMLTGGDWRFVSAREQVAMERMEEVSRSLSAFCVDGEVERGLRTGDNDTFVVDSSTVAEYDLESALLHPLVDGKAVERWWTPWGTTRPEQYVLYVTNNTDLDAYPNARAYLEERRDALEDRWCVAESNDPWYAIDKTKSPDLFERPKIVTPDIVLYNNFWLDDSEEFYCLNTAYQILSTDDVSDEYLLGVLNSDAVQFYYRRIAPTYKDEFLRYISEHVEEIPVPDPSQQDPELVGRVEELARSLQAAVSTYHEAEEIEADPQKAYDRVDVKRDSLALAGYIQRLPDAEGRIADSYVDGATIHLNVSDQIVCRTDAAAASFHRLIDLLGFETIDAVVDAEFPQTLAGLQRVLDTYDDTAGRLDELEATVIDLEADLNDLVYDLYDFDEETREYVANTVETPTTPVEPKAMSE